ncbi:hypothetical protein ACFPN0_00365 [Kitasatospora cinereorecta]
MTVNRTAPRNQHLRGLCDGLLLAQAPLSAEAAFDHLFTPEHRYLLVTAIKVLRDIIGDQLADAIGEFGDLDFLRAAPTIPDRCAVQAEHSASKLAHEARPAE